MQFLTTYAWIDEVYFSPFESERDVAPSYSRWDIRGQWRSPTNTWTIAAFVNNVLDEIGIRQIDRTDEAENFRRSGATTSPRIAGLELRYVMQ
jgi:outer membrane receptor protein involved in Fe transport